jgi:hypothetical protein
MRWRPHVRDYSPGVSDRRISRMLICTDINIVRCFRYVPHLISDVFPQYICAVFAINLSLCGSGVLVPLKLLAPKCSWRYSCELATPRRRSVTIRR